MAEWIVVRPSYLMVRTVAEADSLSVSGGSRIFFKKSETGKRVISYICAFGNYRKCFPNNKRAAMLMTPLEESRLLPSVPCQPGPATSQKGDLLQGPP